MPGTVDKIIPSPRPSQPEKAQIAVKGLTTGIKISVLKIHSDDVKLEKGAHVEVTVTAEPKTSIAADNEGSRPIRRKTAGLGFGRHNS
jgi:hypothetical protein